MSFDRINRIIEQFANGELSRADAVERILSETAADGVIDTGGEPSVRLDADRMARCGQPEIIFGESKQPETLVSITRAQAAKNSLVFITRISDAGFDALMTAFGDAMDYDKLSRTALMNAPSIDETLGAVAVVCAGTSDLPVAAEACRSLEAFGIAYDRIADVGVAGIHRLFGQLERIRKASVVIAVAGMEGALPSVIGGLVSSPVIAVPTSVGYGAAFDGLAALLGMLTCCAQGVTVVNIDNGFGAASAAARILRTASRL
ncbi:MAG: nickel pincer cofactor biosynthesis protein LarB [Planctomycetota bacterium]